MARASRLLLAALLLFGTARALLGTPTRARQAPASPARREALELGLSTPRDGTSPIGWEDSGRLVDSEPLDLDIDVEASEPEAPRPHPVGVRHATEPSAAPRPLFLRLGHFRC